jgi:hypothetical protein
VCKGCVWCLAGLACACACCGDGDDVCEGVKGRGRSLVLRCWRLQPRAMHVGVGRMRVVHASIWLVVGSVVVVICRFARRIEASSCADTALVLPAPLPLADRRGWYGNFESTSNTQLNTLKAVGGRRECICTGFSLRLALMTGGRTAQARIFSPSRHKRTRPAHTPPKEFKVMRGAGELPAARHLQPRPRRQRARAPISSASKMGRLELQQLWQLAACSLSPHWLPQCRAYERDLPHRRCRGVASSAKPTANLGAPASHCIRCP